MKKSRIFLTIIMLALVILVFTGCQGVVPTPSPGATEDTEIIFGRIKMPLTCCVTEEGILEEGSSDEQCDETEDWPFIPNAKVELKSAAKGKCDKVIDTIYTDEKGNYRFENVKPGLYIITVFCPEKNIAVENFFFKDVADKILGQILDAGIPDCTSTALALVIEEINGCYDFNYRCFRKCSTIHDLIKEIVKDVRKIDIEAIMNHKKFGKYCDIPNKDLVDYVCGFECCINPGATGGGGGGGGGDDPEPDTASLEIKKVVTGKEEGYDGAFTFEVRDAANNLVESAFTLTGGGTPKTISGLELGSYKITETELPADGNWTTAVTVNGTSKTLTDRSITVELVTKDTTVTVEFTNTYCPPPPTLTIKKLVECSTNSQFGIPYTGKDLEFTFNITGPGYSDQGGNFKLKDGDTWSPNKELALDQEYTISEISVPQPDWWSTTAEGDSFTPNQTNSRKGTVKLVAGENVVTFTNTWCATEKGNQHILITGTGNLQNTVEQHPEGVIAEMTVLRTGTYHYFSVNLTNTPNGNISGKDGWCLTKDLGIESNKTYNVILLPADEYKRNKYKETNNKWAPVAGQHINMKTVCGILHEKGNKKWEVIQDAIWIETNSITKWTTGAKTLYGAGESYGKTIVIPTCGIVAIPVTECGKAGRPTTILSRDIDVGIPVDKNSHLY